MLFLAPFINQGISLLSVASVEMPCALCGAVLDTDSALSATLSWHVGHIMLWWAWSIECFCSWVYVTTPEIRDSADSTRPLHDRVRGLGTSEVVGKTGQKPQQKPSLVVVWIQWNCCFEGQTWLNTSNCMCSNVSLAKPPCGTRGSRSTPCLPLTLPLTASQPQVQSIPSRKASCSLPPLETSFWKKAFVFKCFPLAIRHSERTMASNTPLVNSLMIKQYIIKIWI